MKKLHLALVDAGCLMLENFGGRWIIQHPTCGHLPTVSKKWDVVIEHPSEPHKEPLKFLGSFDSKAKSIEFVNDRIMMKENYFTIASTENQYYNQDYSQK